MCGVEFKSERCDDLPCFCAFFILVQITKMDNDVKDTTKSAKFAKDVAKLQAETGLLVTNLTKKVG